MLNVESENHWLAKFCSDKEKSRPWLSLLLSSSPFTTDIQGGFFTGPPPKKLKYGKPWLGEARCI